MKEELKGKINEIRRAAAAERDAVVLDPALLALIELKPCRRCRNGFYSTSRGLEGCRTCVTWKPGYRPTTEGMKALRRAQVDSEIRALRAEYKGERAAIRVIEAAGEDASVERAILEGLERRGLALRAEIETL